MGRIIGGTFRIGSKVGSGSWGEVHIGTDTRSGEEVAIKLEPVCSRHPQLAYESKVYRLLAGGFGIPQVRWYGVDGEYHVMVLDLLGPSLEDLFRFCQRRFGLKTVLMLADQILNRLEYVHAQGFVHRDIKPDNFLIGLGAKANQVHLIDFGLAKPFRDLESFEHIRYADSKRLVGTIRFASVNGHSGIEQSRRDDLEAVGYMLVYFSLGRLPWQGLTASSRESGCDMALEAKKATPIGTLCQRLPAEFVTFLEYSRGLGFEDTPDYAFLRRTLRALFVQQGFEYDFEFDWTVMAMTPVPGEGTEEEDAEAAGEAV